MRLERGAEPVATLAALPFHEALLIGALRSFGDGPDAMADYASELGGLYGEGAEGILSQVEEFLIMTLRYARRPLQRLDRKAGSVAADEAVLAHLMSRASEGAHEDAMLIACLLVRADAAAMVVAMAEQLGIALMHRGCRVAMDGAVCSRTLH